MSSETKMMTLDVLSSIKGATSSEAVEELFNNIKNAHPNANLNSNFENNNVSAVLVNDLREDEVHCSSEMEREIIKTNFPKSKDGFLVVSKVIED